MKNLEPDLWVTNYADYLYRYAHSRVNDKAVAEDLVQETFLSAWKARERFEGRSSEKTWLSSILRNKIIDYYRKVLVKDEGISGKKETPISFFSEDGSWMPEETGTDWNLDTGARLESKEFFEIFHGCVDVIKGKSKMAFALKYIDDKKTEDICKELSITPTNYWVLIHRAKLQLRKCLDTKWFNSL